MQMFEVPFHESVLDQSLHEKHKNEELLHYVREKKA
jgi:hypothetical protein